MHTPPIQCPKCGLIDDHEPTCEFDDGFQLLQKARAEEELLNKFFTQEYSVYDSTIVRIGCKLCGVEVLSESTHLAWHETLAKLLP